MSQTKSRPVRQERLFCLYQLKSVIKNDKDLVWVLFRYLCQRKDIGEEKGYPMSMMEPKQISQRWTVFEVLQKHPETRRIFLEKRTFSLGCYMARFCSLRDVAQVYSLNAEAFVDEIQQAAITKTNQNLNKE